MNDKGTKKTRKKPESLHELVGAKAARKLKARRHSGQGVWFGLGMTNLDVFPRLVIAICLPPAIMAALLGGYILVRRPSGGDR